MVPSPEKAEPTPPTVTTPDSPKDELTTPLIPDKSEDIPDTKQIRSDLSQGATTSEFFQRFSLQFLTPKPFRDPVLQIVLTDSMGGFFEDIRSTLISAIYPDVDDHDNFMITNEQFRMVCRYIVKSRIDHVYSLVSGRRNVDRIPLQSLIALPKALADLANSIGKITVSGGAYLVIPAPEPRPPPIVGEDDEPPIPVLPFSAAVTIDMLDRFNQLVMAAHVRGFIRLGYLKEEPEGSRWWLMSPRKLHDNTQISTGDNQIVIVSTIAECTPTDIVYSAIVQYRTDGVLLYDDVIE